MNTVAREHNINYKKIKLKEILQGRLINKVEI